jgi:ABC-type phosphate/phosphonate transport system substrate-binding protein
LDIRLLSFLAPAARAHHEAAGAEAAQAAGLEPLPLEAPGMEGMAGALEGGPALVFVCGLPYTRARDAGLPLEPLAAAVPAGEDAAVYHCDLVGRPGLDGSPRRLGINGLDSLSGYVLPAAAGLDLSRAVLTGGHRRSLELLLAGELDAAPIDSTVLALEARDRPELSALPRLARLATAPSPPVVLFGGDAELAARLRGALMALDRSPAGRDALAAGLVRRYVPVGDADYDIVRGLDARVRGSTMARPSTIRTS